MIGLHTKTVPFFSVSYSAAAAKWRHVSSGRISAAVISGARAELVALEEREGHGTPLCAGHLMFLEQTGREMINISKLECKVYSNAALQMY